MLVLGLLHIFFQQSLTIQWERLPRREREKLDRRQNLISSRFRIIEQARRDSSIPLFVASAPGSEPIFVRDRSLDDNGDGGDGGDSGGGGGGGDSIPSAPARTSNGCSLPPSDAAASSNFDTPSPAAVGRIDADCRRQAQGMGGGEPSEDLVPVVLKRSEIPHLKKENRSGMVLKGDWRGRWGGRRAGGGAGWWLRGGVPC